MRNIRCDRWVWAGVLGLASACASADESRCRFVERVGNVDVVLPGNQIDFSLQPRRIRVQVGVFDDAHGEASPGGVVGWVGGSMDATRLTARRTPGRLPLFQNPGGGNGVPGTDPFVQLIEIDARLSGQVAWGCNGGTALPMPTPTIRGRNTYVSVYEVTVSPALWCVFGQAFLDVRGSLRTAESWQVSGTPVEPVCPSTPGSVLYEPLGVRDRQFEARLTLTVGAPGWPGPACPPDWNRDGLLNSQDFFEFLEDFFGGFADYSCDGVLDSNDFFQYLAAFFTGC